MSKIIFLNGCSSAGKSSIVKAIQNLDKEIWLTFGIDTTLESMPDKYFGFGKQAERGFQFVSSADEEGFPITEVKTGSYGMKISNSIPKIVKQLADDGHNLIIDEVIWEREDLEKYSNALNSHKVCYIKVNCELPLMEEREIIRGNRGWGLARAQYAKMKDLEWKYELQIDTSQTNVFANDRKILEQVNK